METHKVSYRVFAEKCTLMFIFHIINIDPSLVCLFTRKSKIIFPHSSLLSFKPGAQTQLKQVGYGPEY